MKLEDCKIGMKVKALRQGDKSTFDWKYFLNHNLDSVAPITKVEEGRVQLSDFSWFMPENLEPYIEPEETEYRQLKDITPKAIYESRGWGEGLGCFMQEFTRFVTTFDLEYDDVLSFSDLTWELENEPEWEKWLIQHGFIEKVVEEVTYAVGDALTNDQGMKAILAQIKGLEVAIIPLTGSDKGNRWVDPMAVNNLRAITVKEFSLMQGSDTSWRKDK